MTIFYFVFLLIFPLKAISDPIYAARNTYGPVNFEKSNEVWREADRIVSLPDLDPMPSFPMYSGYLNINSTDHLFYWLAHSTDESSNKLIVWYNGGPGCSSLDGLFYENGPIMFDTTTGKLIENPYSWNKLGHILFIESPIETGFSYTDDKNPDRYLDDDQNAKMNLKALKDFYKKFPRFKSMDLYITGESYAGVYIPTLAVSILEDVGFIKDQLKGLYIGNGLMHKKLNADTLVEYGYYHGFIGPQLWKELQRLCCKDKGNCVYDNYINNECMERVSEYRHAIYSEGLNIYNYAEDCAVPNDRVQGKYQRYYGWNNKEAGQHRLYLQPICSDATLLTNYLNRPDVRNALHARQVQDDGGRWEMCRTQVFFNYNQIMSDMGSTIKRILRSMDVKIVLYYGDFDLACNFLGGERFVDQLGLEMTTSRRKWTVSRNGNPQIAGFYKEFGNLLFATVKAAGHMVPTDKPAEIFEFIRRVMDDEPL